MDFTIFKNAVARQFAMMAQHQLFRVDASKDEMWDTYLSSFPVGTNPIYRERTEHDCSCCRHFIRDVGNVVAIIDEKVVSIWDITVDEPAYQTVAKAMSMLIKSKPITNIFLSSEKTAGTNKNFEQTVEGVKTWNHFYVNIPANFVKPKAAIGPALNDAKGNFDVLSRSLDEITLDAVDTVLELIQQNSLYRGDEHKFAVTEFRKLKKSFLRTNESTSEWVWQQSVTAKPSVSRIRNTSIGTLLVDLSEGMELDAAVRKFEAMVAPANYKRPTALVTKAMIESAKKKIEELGLTSALPRRFAQITDISINNILFADRTVRNRMGGDVFDELLNKTGNKPKNLDKVEEVSIDKFIGVILPTAQSIEVMFENSHKNNLVSLIAPVDPTANQLFKWSNPFSWSYAGNFADSIKERVKAAGGSVTGDVCCRLAWNNTDDLDFHMNEPRGSSIYYATRKRQSINGGMLDVDANGADGIRPDPVENIFYADKKRMYPGEYRLSVHQFNKRGQGNGGFEVEIEIDGVVTNMVYEKDVRQGEFIEVATLTVDKNHTVTLTPHLPSTQTSKTFWNLPTQNFHKVNVMMMSPNHWDGQGVGNKHYFFMLDGCRNDDTARGFYNEFLKSDLDAHRKVIEMVGAKMKVEDSDNQLSGLGFSSTQRNSLLVRVTGNFTRIIKVLF